METSGTSWDLAHLLAVLRRRRLWIVGSVVLAMVVAIVLSLVAAPQYRSEAKVLVEPAVVQSNPQTLGRVAFLDQELYTQQQLIDSEAVARRVAEALELESPREVTDRVESLVLPATRVLRVTASDADPQRAAQLAQTVAEEYLAFRREEAVSDLIEATRSMQTQLDTAESNLERVDERIDATDDPAELLTLRDERETLIGTVNTLSTQLARLESAEPVRRGSGRIIQDAQPPESPSSPQPVRNSAVALVLGLGIGVVLALAAEALDRTVGSVEQATTLTGKPVLGRIPISTEEAGGSLPMLRQPGSPVSESFRDLRTNLRFVGDAGPARSVVVTSAIEGEGKSLTAANLALAAVATGQRVLLVDADLRRPAVGRTFGLDQDAGLSTVLAGEHDLDEVLLELEQSSLHLLLAGVRPPNPNELVSSQRMKKLLARLDEHFDLVVVDVPPLLAVPDVLEIAGSVDATLLVVELQRSERHEVVDACERLDRVGADLVGLVVNRVDLDPGRYGYGYEAS